MARWHRTQIAGLGDIDVSKILSYASKVPQYATTIMEVIDDPYLPETACQIDRVYEARHGYPIKTCNKMPPDGSSSGLGLNRAIPVLRAVAYAEQHKWIYPLAVAAILGIPFMLGYRTAERKRTP